jgi:hypothetical protein
MNNFSKYGLVWAVILLLPALFLQAQKPATQKKPVATPAVPAIKPDTVKVPRFTVRFGPYTSTAPAPLDDLKKVLGTGITVTDQQGQQWTPLAWRFVWNRIEQSNDIRTGKQKTISTYNAVEIDSTGVLPASWQKEIKEFLQKGEELMIERIIIEHPGSKRKMMAPDWKIRVI